MLGLLIIFSREHYDFPGSMMSDFPLSLDYFGGYTVRLWILFNLFFFLAHIPLVEIKRESQMGMFVQLPARSSVTTLAKVGF